MFKCKVTNLIRLFFFCFDPRNKEFSCFFFHSHCNIICAAKQIQDIKSAGGKYLERPNDRKGYYYDIVTRQKTRPFVANQGGGEWRP